MKIVKDLEQSNPGSIWEILFPRPSSRLRISLNYLLSLPTCVALSFSLSRFIFMKMIFRFMAKVSLASSTYCFTHLAFSEIYYGIIRRHLQFDNANVHNLLSSVTTGLIYLNVYKWLFPSISLIYYFGFAISNYVFWTSVELIFCYYRTRIYQLDHTNNKVTK